MAVAKAPKKTKDEYDYELDWKDTLSKLTYDKNDDPGMAGVTQKATLSYQMLGEKSMSPGQRKILTKMNDTGIDKVKKSTQSKLQARLDEYEDDLALLVKQAAASPKVRKEKDKHTTALKKDAMADIKNILDDGQASAEAVIDKNVSTYVKGKHHKRKKITQIVKHTVKTPLSIAMVPVGFLLSASGLGTPIGIVALKNSVGSLKATADYIRYHKKGYAGIEKSINRNIAAIKGTADRYETLADEALNGRDDATKAQARKELGLVKREIGRNEVAAKLASTFLHAHKKSIGNFKNLTDKYRKKVNKHKYLVINMGRKLEKLKTDIANIDKGLQKFDADTRKMQAGFIKHNIPTGEIRQFLADRQRLKTFMEKKRDEIVQKRRDIKSEIDKEVARVLDMEEKFEDWLAKLEEFRAQRPNSLQHWKRAINTLNFINIVGEAGLTAGSDAMTSAWDGLSGVASALGHLGELSDAAQDQWNNIKSKWG